MIITLINSKIKFKKSNNNTISWISDYFLNLLRQNGVYIDKYNEYKITIDYHDFFVLCPRIKMAGASQSVVLFPSLIIARKRYPAYVYLFAVALYLSSSFSMREVANKVKTKFGLDTFSHSTLCRTLKSIKKNINLLCSSAPSFKEETADEDLEEFSISSNYSFCKDLTYPTAVRIYSVLKPVLMKFKSYSALLIYNYFLKSGGQYFF